MRKSGSLIIIANPSRQHSDQLAAALVEAEHDVMYIHGSPIRRDLRQILSNKHIMRPTGRIISRLSSKIFSNAFAIRVLQWTYTMFDRRVARIIRKRRPAAVILYENSALHSFNAAREIGAKLILDAADVHHSLQNEPTSPFRTQVNMQKDLEIGMADDILTCSSLAYESYRTSSVDQARLHQLPLGVDLASFCSKEVDSDRLSLRILFVGRLTFKKGIDIFADALEHLVGSGLAFDLKVAADLDIVDFQVDARLARIGTLLGKVPHDALPDLYAWADVLVVPSRFDSFGLVVFEALACGLPTIVSDHVGAKDVIEDGVNGYIFRSGNSDALGELLSNLARNPIELRSMRQAARQSVEGAEWSNYRGRAAATILKILESQ